MKLPPGIYKDRRGYRAVVNIAAGRKQKRFPADASLLEIKKWRNETRVKLETLHPQKRAGAMGRGTFSADMKRYLKTLAIASWKSSRSCLRAWEQRFGPRKRRHVTADHVKAAVKAWTDAGVSPKTILNRVRVLTAMYHALDGEHAWTPADDITLPTITKRNPDYVPPATIIGVEVRLRELEAAGEIEPAWRARFMVLASTGQRPVFVKRAKPGDVDVIRKVWNIDAAKGGNPIRLPLNADMVAAWERFLEVNVWGDFDSTEYASIVRLAGWPQHARPYATKHSVSQDMGEGGVDLETIADWHGHTGGFKTTRIYTGFVVKKLRLASDALEGRLGWGKPEISPGHVAQSDEKPSKAQIEQALALLRKVGYLGS